VNILALFCVVLLPATGPIAPVEDKPGPQERRESYPPGTLFLALSVELLEYHKLRVGSQIHSTDRSRLYVIAWMGKPRLAEAGSWAGQMVRDLVLVPGQFS